MSFTRFKIEPSKQEFYTSTSGLALVGVALNRFTTLASRVDKVGPKRGIATSDVIRSYLGLLCQGKSDFAAIRPFFEDDEFFRCSLGLAKVPPPETLRQRLDQFAERLRTIVDVCSVEFLKKAKAQLSPLPSGHMPLDLGDLAGDLSSAVAIKDLGQILLKSSSPEGDRTLLYENGQVKNLGNFGTEYAVATDINNRGELVGWLETENGELRAFVAKPL